MKNSGSYTWAITVFQFTTATKKNKKTAIKKFNFTGGWACNREGLYPVALVSGIFFCLLVDGPAITGGGLQAGGGGGGLITGILRYTQID